VLGNAHWAVEIEVTSSQGIELVAVVSEGYVLLLELSHTSRGLTAGFLFVGITAAVSRELTAVTTVVRLS